MRDPDRIDKILHELGIIWKQNPDMRFGQFLTNYIYVDGKINWFYEDDNFLMDLVEFNMKQDKIKVKKPKTKKPRK